MCLLLSKHSPRYICPPLKVAEGAGHHSVLRLPGGDDQWVICYHRRPLDASDDNHRVVCLDRLEFRPDGTIAPVTLTHHGVDARLVR